MRARAQIGLWIIHILRGNRHTTNCIFSQRSSALADMLADHRPWRVHISTGSRIDATYRHDTRDRAGARTAAFTRVAAVPHLDAQAAFRSPLLPPHRRRTRCQRRRGARVRVHTATSYSASTRRPMRGRRVGHRSPIAATAIGRGVDALLPLSARMHTRWARVAAAAAATAAAAAVAPCSASTRRPMRG